MRKLRKAIGIILLVVLLAPVLVLAIPSTVSVPVVIQENPRLIGFVEHRYIPLIEVANAWREGPLTHSERAVPFVYFGLYVLAIWLIRYKGRKKAIAQEETS